MITESGTVLEAAVIGREVGGVDAIERQAEVAIKQMAARDVSEGEVCACDPWSLPQARIQHLGQRR